jgi:hypothetical protein
MPCEIISEKSVTAVASTAGKAIDLVHDFGRFAGRVMGTVPEDMVGVLGGDLLKHVRVRIGARLQQRTDQILRERGVTQTQAVSPSIAVPLLQAATSEDREELREMWARLLATAMNPNAPKVSLRFIEALRQFEPLDALLLKRISSGFRITICGSMVNSQVPDGASHDEVYISLENLERLRCIQRARPPAGAGAINENVDIAPFGRELLRACGS